jgi:RNA 3'-terminal phosphate cyclase
MTLKRYGPPRGILPSVRRVMLDLSELSGDPTPVSLSALIRANREPGVAPMAYRDVRRLQRLRPGEAASLPIGGGTLLVRRTKRLRPSS